MAHSIGMDELKKARFDSHDKCPACAMGKAQRNAVTFLPERNGLEFASKADEQNLHGSREFIRGFNGRI
jgi:hypothetical protein